MLMGFKDNQLKLKIKLSVLVVDLNTASVLPKFPHVRSIICNTLIY